MISAIVSIEKVYTIRFGDGGLAWSPKAIISVDGMDFVKMKTTDFKLIKAILQQINLEKQLKSTSRPSLSGVNAYKKIMNWYSVTPTRK